MANQSSVRILLGGGSRHIGSLFATALEPQYEIAGFITPGESGVQIASMILSGQSSSDTTTSTSGDRSDVPRAVVLGPAFDQEVTKRFRDTIRAQGGARKVPWLMQDMSKGPPVSSPEYFNSVVLRVKEILVKFEQEGKLSGDYDELEWY